MEDITPTDDFNPRAIISGQRRRRATDADEMTHPANLANATSDQLRLVIAEIALVAGRLRHENHVLEEKLKLAHDKQRHDDLTEISNRFYIDEVLNEIINPDPDEIITGHFYFAGIDLDKFKWINDNIGHWAGDIALKKAAETLRLHVRPTDTVGRLGGDEFAVIFEAENDRAASLVVERLRREFENLWVIADKPSQDDFPTIPVKFQVMASLGYIRIDPQAYLGLDPKAALETVKNFADQAMYLEKQGRAIVRGAAPEPRRP